MKWRSYAAACRSESITLYRIVATDRVHLSVEIHADEVAPIYTVLEQLDCLEADILADGVYAFSLRREESGWSMFERDLAAGWQELTHFG